MGLSMLRLPPANAIRAFEAASRHLSFQAAAEELGVTPSALSHQIRQLESLLQFKLFHRRHRQVELTSGGALLAEKVGEGYDKIREGFAQLLPDTDDRRLVVTTGPAFSAKWLAPRLHFFLEENPEIDFRLSASLALADFVGDGIDLAVRFGGGDYPGLFVEKLFDEVAMPLIAPALYEAAGGKPAPSLFEKVSLIHDDSAKFLAGGVDWEDWLAAMGYRGELAARGSHFSHADHAIEAAVDQAGMVFSRLGLAYRDIATGRLIAPFDLALQVAGGFYFVAPENHLAMPKVLAFLGWIRDEAAEQSAAMAALLAAKKVIRKTALTDR